MTGGSSQVPFAAAAAPSITTKLLHLMDLGGLPYLSASLQVAACHLHLLTANAFMPCHACLLCTTAATQGDGLSAYHCQL
jgi:hypothetical protein